LSGRNENPTTTVPVAAGTVRYQVLALFCVFAALTYLHRICLAQAAKPMRESLGIDARQMGYLFAAFTLAYGLFEVPAGWLGDRIGPRKVIVGLVVFWSAFMALTGAAWNFATLWLGRFAVGAGQAGAFPNVARALTSWFPPWQRARVQGVLWTCARSGGMIAAPLTVGFIGLIGWRATFFVYALIGVAWAAVFWWWYRDEPADHPAITPEETTWLGFGRNGAAAELPEEYVPAPWRNILTNLSVWGLAGTFFCSSFSWWFFATWLPTYLIEERHMAPERAAWYASLPFFFGLPGCLMGGWISDRLVLAWGSTRWARRIVGWGGATLSGVCFLGSLAIPETVPAVLLMTLTGFFNDLTLTCAWTAAMDLAERDAGRVGGLVNSLGALGAFLSPMLLGDQLQRGQGWTFSLVILGLVYFVCAACWLLVDPTRTVAARGAQPEESGG
jgi:sugar phosphate permease